MRDGRLASSEWHHRVLRRKHEGTAGRPFPCSSTTKAGGNEHGNKNNAKKAPNKSKRHCLALDHGPSGLGSEELGGGGLNGRENDQDMDEKNVMRTFPVFRTHEHCMIMFCQPEPSRESCIVGFPSDLASVQVGSARLDN
jgi:hypothetical protein